MKKNRNPKVAAAGHICLDITPDFPERNAEDIGNLLQPGQLLQMGKADIHIGGAVANTGMALKFFGADVSFMGKIGKDRFGELIYSQMKQWHAQKGLIVSEETDSSYSIVLAPHGIDRMFLHYSGANDHFYKKDLDFSVIEEAELFHFGYPPLMKSMYENDGEELAEIFRQVKKCNTLTSLDMAAVDENGLSGQAAWDKILRKVLPYVDFFVPSAEEIAFMIDRARLSDWKKRAAGKDITEILNPEKDIRPLAEKLLEYGAKIVLIKCGALGMYFATAKEDNLLPMGNVLKGGAEKWAGIRQLEKSYQPEKVLSGTGAGDTSIAAFLYAVLIGKSYQECLQLAAATGASCVTAYDALSGLKSFKELEEKIENGWEKRSL